MVIDPDFWRGRRVFLTGHTGFKGAWASLLLSHLGAEVYGFALAPEHEAGLFEVAGIARELHHVVGDVRELPALGAALKQAQPSVVLHMAAQSLVRMSYTEPVETYATNVMGTVHLLDAIRQAPGVEAVVIVTSDKCYENRNWFWGYRETDRLGGHDPYSNSKGCAELVTDSYRRSFFSSQGAPHIATARAGNVIGGGDWARDRLVPDAIRAFSAGKGLKIRNPQSVRPWQHVLEPVTGYLLLAERLVNQGARFAEAWNFGPFADSEVPVEQVVDALARLWGGSAHWARDRGEHPHEAAFLKLDCSKTLAQLGWRPRLTLERALSLSVDWYRACEGGADMRQVTLEQIDGFLGSPRQTTNSRSVRVTSATS